MADGASFKKFARSTRGSPRQQVTKHGFPTLQTLFSSKTCERVIFSKCLPTRKKVADSLESKIRFKNSFPAVLNNLSHSNNIDRGTHKKNWRRPFIYFAVLGVVNATQNEQKSPNGDSHIRRPSEEDTLPYRFNVRTLNGRFAKSKRARKKIYAPISTTRK